MKHVFCLVVLCAVGNVFQPLYGQVQFHVPITVLNGANSQVLTIGVSGDGPGGSIQDNTIGADVELSFGTFQELLAPPAPPAPFDFDVRIITIPSRVATYPIGLGGGVYKDFRGFENLTKVDSFRIKLAGDGFDNNQTTISWPANLNQYGSQWTIKPQSGTEWGPVDMLQTTSTVLPAGIPQKNVMIIKVGVLTGVIRTDDVLPSSYDLMQNFPNPFNPSTEIRFSLPSSSKTSLVVYNILGQEIATLVNEVKNAGNYSVRFDAANVPSGTYFYRLESSGHSELRKMLLLK